MASLGHLAVGVATGRWRAMDQPGAALVPSMAVLSVLSVLPDADVVAFRLGIPYGDPFGHRGMTHSLAFALAMGVLAGVVQRLRERPWPRDALLVAAVVASHGLLDACTTGGKGVEFFWPVDTGRYFLPWALIPVAPIGGRMLSARGLHVVLFEAVLFLPAWLYAFWPRSRPAPQSRPPEF